MTDSLGFPVPDPELQVSEYVGRPYGQFPKGSGMPRCIGFYPNLDLLDIVLRQSEMPKDEIPAVWMYKCRGYVFHSTDKV